jgi:uncharacterized protein (DUF1501 family)
MHRRRFLQLGGVSLWSGGLLDVLAARAAPTVKPTAKACIVLFQVGGPYQCDTFDPKPGAPEEMRGPYKPTATPVPGLHISESLPRVAAHADKLAILRGVHHTIRCHNPAMYCSLVGREATAPLAVSNQTAARPSDHPNYASVVARLRPSSNAMPHHVIIPGLVQNGPARTPGLLGGYLGHAYDPFVLNADPAAANFRVEGVGLPDDVQPERLDNRKALLRRLDNEQRRLETSEAGAAMDDLRRRAFAMLTSPRTKTAFDLGREPDRLRDRYGRHTSGQGALLARRLVEAGVPFVTVFSHTVVEKESWDTHDRHDELNRKALLPQTDAAFGALLADLSVRGLLDETLVVWLGEFGRSPRRGVQFSNAGNTAAGRDHWCNCYSVVLAGGGVRGGQVIGSSDWIGAYPKERAVHVSDLAATIYHALGVDPRGVVHDIQGQPHNVCDGRPVEELF